MYLKSSFVIKICLCLFSSIFLTIAILFFTGILSFSSPVYSYYNFPPTLKRNSELISVLSSEIRKYIQSSPITAIDNVQYLDIVVQTAATKILTHSSAKYFPDRNSTLLYYPIAELFVLIDSPDTSSHYNVSITHLLAFVPSYPPAVGAIKSDFEEAFIYAPLVRDRLVHAGRLNASQIDLLNHDDAIRVRIAQGLRYSVENFIPMRPCWKAVSAAIKQQREALPSDSPKRPLYESMVLYGFLIKEMPGDILAVAGDTINAHTLLTYNILYDLAHRHCSAEFVGEFQLPTM